MCYYFSKTKQACLERDKGREAKTENDSNEKGLQQYEERLSGNIENKERNS